MTGKSKQIELESERNISGLSIKIGAEGERGAGCPGAAKLRGWGWCEYSNSTIVFFYINDEM